MTLKNILTAAAIVAAPALCHAQSAYPEHPIRLIVPFAPGGGTDIVGRLVAENLGRELKQTVVVENKPGAGAALGATFVANSDPTGYTLLLGTSAELTIGPNLRKVAYDPVKGFEPIARVGVSPNIILSFPKAGIKNISQLVAAGKSPGSHLSYGSGGVGTGPHLSGELLSSMGKFPFLHVPYRGSGPAMVAIMSGEVPIVVSTLAPAIPMVKEGSVVAVAVTSAERASSLPQVPTVAEQGLPGYESVTWYALMAPAGVPQNVRDTLRAAMGKVLKQPDVLTKLNTLGIETIAVTESPDAIRKRIAAELAGWGRLIKSRNIKVE